MCSYRKLCGNEEREREREMECNKEITTLLAKKINKTKIAKKVINYQ